MVKGRVTHCWLYNHHCCLHATIQISQAEGRTNTTRTAPADQQWTSWWTVSGQSRRLDCTPAMCQVACRRLNGRLLPSPIIIRAAARLHACRPCLPPSRLSWLSVALPRTVHHPGETLTVTMSSAGIRDTSVPNRKRMIYRTVLCFFHVLNYVRCCVCDLYGTETF